MESADESLKTAMPIFDLGREQMIDGSRLIYATIETRETAEARTVCFGGSYELVTITRTKKLNHI